MLHDGEQLGRFRVERLLGKGASGVVYLAVDTGLDTRVALKVLHSWVVEDEITRERFKREIVLTRRIAHPGVCRTFEFHQEGDARFITMEFIEGKTLAGLLTEAGGRIEVGRTLRIIRKVAQALGAAHEAGVLHRDLKPANVMVRTDDEPVILDFGTATAADVSRVTRPGLAVGSMRF